ncbi:hypothetical protein BB558_001534 [Smittium angustum]|uniref:Transcription factor domain-containing protein n=1 Tax=Smittium angustum TaxID=133377 RepID=A0A2U1JBI3_SMIAN|nr:hypothetical protein BB558_001534 [Smittium angustum]
MCLILPHILPSTMMPARLPEFNYKFLNLMYPNYFVYAVLSVGIKYTHNTRTDHDKLQEILYAKKSLEIIKSISDASDPLILWACLFVCGYGYGIDDEETYHEVLEIAYVFAKNTKLYCMDFKKNSENQTIHNNQELEFKRRIWWAYYIQISSEYIFSGKKIYFEDRDIVVNPPTNDFEWKYCIDTDLYSSEETKAIALISAKESHNCLPNDSYQFLISSYALFKSINYFTVKRSRKNDNKSKTGIEISFFQKKLDEYKRKLNEIYNCTLDYIGHKYKFNSGSTKLLIETEPYLFAYIFKQLYNSMTIHLYQSELVEYTNEIVSPERIKIAKTNMINASTGQINLLEWYRDNIPENYMEFLTIPWTVYSAITMINSFFIKGLEFRDHYTNNLNKMIEIYRIMEKNSEIMSSVVTVIKSLIETKSKMSEQNSKLTHLYKHMEPYGIETFDIEPWIVPKYGSLFFFNHFYKEGWSTSHINEYLQKNKTKIESLTTKDNPHDSQSKCTDIITPTNRRKFIGYATDTDLISDIKETKLPSKTPKIHKNKSKNKCIEKKNDTTKGNNISKSTSKTGNESYPKIPNTKETSINKDEEFGNYLKRIRNSISDINDSINQLDYQKNSKKMKM